MDVEQLTGPVAYHGEGPVWFPDGRLRFVDMLAGDVLTLSEDGTLTRTHHASVVAALRPRRGGGAVLGVERGFALLDAEGTLETLPEVWSDPGVRMNEGACDPDGRFYCGSMAYDQTPGAASLYRLDPDGTVGPVLTDVTVSNGLAWSPDGRLAYYNDSATHAIQVFDYDARTGLTDGRVFARLDGDAQPDGLTVDAEGGVWTAVANGSAVLRYGPHGVLDQLLRVPARKVTAVTFGGPQLDRLYITTSQEDVDVEADPAAGSLFTAEPGVQGLPVAAFDG